MIQWLMTVPKKMLVELSTLTNQIQNINIYLLTSKSIH